MNSALAYNLQAAGGRVQGTTTGWVPCAMYWSADLPNPNQYSKAMCVITGNSVTAPMVRCQTSSWSCYYYNFDGGAPTLRRMDSGSSTVLATGSANPLRPIEVKCTAGAKQPDTIKGYLGWGLEQVSVTDTTYPTGYVGLMIACAVIEGSADDFSGGDLAIAPRSPHPGRFLRWRPVL
jgi:hypothetical protein